MGPFPPKSLLVLLGAVLAALPGAWQQLAGLAAALGFGVSFPGAICLRVWKHGLCGGTLAGLYSGTVLKGSRWGICFYPFIFIFFFLSYQNYSVAVCKVTQSCLGFS